MLYFVAFIFALTFFLTYLSKSYLRMIYLAAKFPGPNGLPIVGAALKFWNKTPSGTYIYVNFYDII